MNQAFNKKSLSVLYPLAAVVFVFSMGFSDCTEKLKGDEQSRGGDGGSGAQCQPGDATCLPGSGGGDDPSPPSTQCDVDVSPSMTVGQLAAMVAADGDAVDAAPTAFKAQRVCVNGLVTRLNFQLTQ